VSARHHPALRLRLDRPFDSFCVFRRGIASNSMRAFASL